MAVIDLHTNGGLRGVSCRNEPLARYTAWGIGGPADRYYRPADVDDLAVFLARLPEAEPVFWLGLGSNLLVRDGGIAGTVIHLANTLGGIEQTEDHGLFLRAGVPCPKAARVAVRRGLSGCEFFAGIPGTVGGALAMNAGAFGGETWDIVRKVETIDRRGWRHTRHPNEFQVGYRSVRGTQYEWFVGAELVLRPDEDGAAAERVRALLKRRSDSQPLKSRSCGSVFRNPPGDHAARLIEACGLKGEREGDAVVSPKHANFIINENKASAAQIEALMHRVMDTVERVYGLRLEPEVQIVGRYGGRRDAPAAHGPGAGA
ncbi:MAG: UDP-N-acetylmuramate dehydrogenase [Gammaproteobacteria bacterium]